MSKRLVLDSVRWEAQVQLKSHGVDVLIRANRAELLKNLPSYLPPLSKPSRARKPEIRYSLFQMEHESPAHKSPAAFRLYAGERRLAEAGERKVVLQRLESELQHFVAAMTGEKVFIHAGVVGWHGRAILIPGPSHTGKSTLVHALVQAGAAYYSDEYAPLDANGRVHPYTRPLRLRASSGGMRRRAAGPDMPLEPLPVGAVFVGKYRPGAKWNPRPLTPGEALLSLLKNAVSVRRQPEATIQALRRSLAAAAAFRTFRGEAKDAARMLLEEVTRTGTDFRVD